ncbi:hypothetical protein BHE74_00025911 [Ensete ventricosum]|nr:hypothetical protein BHE74_00025911 [Ensete ventricosum]
MGDSSSTGFFLPAQGDEARKEKGERGEASSPRAGRRQHPVSPRKNAVLLKSIVSCRFRPSTVDFDRQWSIEEEKGKKKRKGRKKKYLTSSSPVGGKGPQATFAPARCHKRSLCWWGIEAQDLDNGALILAKGDLRMGGRRGIAKGAYAIGGIIRSYWELHFGEQHNGKDYGFKE